MSGSTEETRRRKVYRASSFAMSAMTCPGCGVTVGDPVDQCPRCGYTGHQTVEKFPFPAPMMERFIDPTGYLTENDRSKIRKALADLAKMFPQPRLCFSILELFVDVDIREFGFWMLNASPVEDREEARLRPWTILMIIDDANGRVSVTSGYAIEPFLDDERLTAVLRLDRQHLFARDYATGILKFIKGVEEVLKEGADRVERTKKKTTSGGSGRERSRK